MRVEALQPLGYRLSGEIQAATKLVLEPGGSAVTRSREFSSIALAVGPEGGWSERDLAQLALAGFSAVAIGPRILRTETAGIAAISVMQALLGDFAR